VIIFSIGITVLNLGRYIGISAEILVFYPIRDYKCKILPDIILDFGQYIGRIRVYSIYHHVTYLRSFYKRI